MRGDGLRSLRRSSFGTSFWSEGHSASRQFLLHLGGAHWHRRCCWADLLDDYRTRGSSFEESLKIAALGAFGVIALVVGIGLRQLKPWSRVPGLVFYPAVMAALFIAALIAGELTGKVLALLVLGLPLAISFGVLSYLTLYGEGAAEAFAQPPGH